MYYVLEGHEEYYIVQSIIQLFYKNEEYVLCEDIKKEGVTIKSKRENLNIYSFLYKEGKLVDTEVLSFIDGDNVSMRRQIKYTIYKMLKREIKIDTSWGMLTGIRPTKIVRELHENDMSYEDIKIHMKNFYEISDNKADLIINIAKKQDSILKNNNGKDMSLYIGIPFCPTKCFYCSFTSYLIEKYKNNVDSYINALIKEMEYGKKYSENRILENIYIGGGTPTSLEPYQLEKLLYNVCNKFDTSNLKEFTVEAGRVDTITLEKLKIIKKYNITRISINPQTMNDKTLNLIGRSHTAKEFEQKYHMSREMGFNNINVDIIVGLTEEDVEDVIYTMEKIFKLSPDSITVHTLAIKRSSRLKKDFDNNLFDAPKKIEKMLDITKEYAQKLNMEPYYMYRQKNMLGNFENIGYSKNGFEGVYNIQIMEEKQNILALGSGASSKFVDLLTNKIEKVYNVKDVLEYINRIDEMIQKKDKLGEF